MPAVVLYLLVPQFTYLLTDQPDHLAFRVLTVGQELGEARRRLVRSVPVQVPASAARMRVAYHFPQGTQRDSCVTVIAGIIFTGMLKLLKVSGVSQIERR